MSIFTRSLKEINAVIIIFYQALGGLVFTAGYITIEAIINGEGFRIGTYTYRQYGIATIIALIETVCAFLFVFSFRSDTSQFVSLL